MKPADVSAILNIPFVQIALPIIITFIIASWRDGKRFDDINRRIDDMINRIDEVIKRLDRIDGTLSEFAQRIVRVEERTSPLAR